MKNKKVFEENVKQIYVVKGVGVESHQNILAFSSYEKAKEYVDRLNAHIDINNIRTFFCIEKTVLVLE